MATGEAFASGSSEDWRTFLTCSLCLEIYKSPKLLPCYHCFCQTCLEDLASRHGSGPFPCPQCTREISVPPGGVTAFQDNIHLNPNDLERARSNTLCLIHQKQYLKYYCVDCRQPVCGSCCLTDHKPHVTEDLDKGVGRVMQQLKKDEKRLRTAVSRTKERLEAGKKEQQSARDKKKAVEKAIRRKQAWLKSVVDKCCEDALASLTKVGEDSDERLTKELDCQQKSLDQLSQLWQQVKQAVGSGEGCQVMRAAKEMKHGWGGLDIVNQLTPPERRFVYRPVLNYKETEDTLTPLIRDFFGVVDEMKMDATTASEVKIVEQFHCGKKDEENLEVFSLCPYDDGCQVVMSFARRGIVEDAPSERFDFKDSHISTLTYATGRTTWKSRASNSGIYVSNNDKCSQVLYDKSQQKTILRLKTSSSTGTADIQTAIVTSENPLQTQRTILFAISVGWPRGFTVDASEQHYVVLEEADPASEIQRKVRLYHRGQRHAVATYQPPSSNCRPSDVCFWREPSGRETLVVADEGMDVLHLVLVQKKCSWMSVPSWELKFEGYLAQGSPLIVQPTALNTDTLDRLWVAMRGGRIITVSGNTG